MKRFLLFFHPNISILNDICPVLVRIDQYRRMGCREHKRGRRSERELAQYDQHSGVSQSVQVRRHPVEPCRPATGMAALVRRAIHRTVRLPSLFYANYTIGYDKRTFKGNAYGIGCSWGYSKLLSTRWNFIVEIGAGIVYTPLHREAAAEVHRGVRRRVYLSSPPVPARPDQM